MSENIAEKVEDKVVTEKPIKTPKPKTADKPHHVSLILSIAAIIISCLGWWESHQNRILNEGVNRPILILDNTTPDYGGPSSNGGIYISFGLKLKNVGKTGAKIQNYEILLSYQRGLNDECKFEGLQANTVRNPRPTEILPGMEETFYGGELVYPGCNKSSLPFGITTEVTYYDDSGRYYVQTFSAETDVPLDTLKKKNEELKKSEQRN